MNLNYAVGILTIAILGCGKKDSSENNGKVGARVRSTGAKTIALALQGLDQQFGTNLTSTVTRSSNVTLDYYKVPIARVNLVTGLTGSGYTSASPNLYTCASSTESECLIDIGNKSAVDNLLKTAGKSTVTTIEAEGATEAEVPEATYNGTAVEFCIGSSKTFSARFKGTVVLGSTTYYTNSTSGLSSTAPAEEVTVPVKNIGCGMTTPLFSPITVSKDSPTNVVLYTDPTGAALAVTSDLPPNLGCLGNGPGVCTEPVGIFSTVDTANPTVERYLLNFGTGEASAMLTLVLNTENKVFGAMIRTIYANDTNSPVVGSSSITEVENVGDDVTLKTWDGNQKLTNLISSFQRKNHTGTIKITLAGGDKTYTATKL